MHWSLLAIGAAGGFVAYNVSVQMAGEKINAFLFTTILTIVALIVHMAALGIYKMTVDGAIQFDKSGLIYAVLAGISVAVIDLMVFFMLKNGGGLSMAIPFVSVVSTGVTALIGFCIFKEVLSIWQGFGLVLGIVSIGLLVK